MCYLAALLICAVAVGGGCLSPHEFQGGADSDVAKISTSIADAVLAKIAPISTESARVAAVEATKEVLARRREENKDENDPITAEEWAYIGAAILTAMLGLNKYRNMTRKKALGKT